MSEEVTGPQPDEPEETPATPAVSSVALKRPPVWTIGVMTFAMLTAFFLSQVAQALFDSINSPDGAEDLWERVSLLLAGAAVTVSFVVRRVYASRRPMMSARFCDDHLEVPASGHALKVAKVAYRDILAVYLGGYPPNMRVLVESRSRMFALDQLWFVNEEGPEKLFSELRRRIKNLPNGDEILALMKRRQSVANQTLSLRPWATHLLLGVMVIMYVNQQLLGGLDPMGALAWGANHYTLVAEGELYRLISANFLHGPIFIHILLNGVSFLSLGGITERLLGRERFLVIFFVSCLGAMVASAFFHDTFSLGASGGVLGLFGGFTVLHLKYDTDLPMGIRQNKRWWISTWAILIGISLVPLIMPVKIDLIGHLAGFIVGAVVTYLVLDNGTGTRPAPAAPTGTKVIAAALSVLFAVGIGMALWQARGYGPEKRLSYATKLGAAYLTVSDPEPNLLNFYAWEIATHPQAAQAELGLAERLISKSLSRIEGESAWWQSGEGLSAGLKDTQNTVWYRQGRFAESAKAQRSVIESSVAMRQSGLFELWSQLERFMAADVDKNGPQGDALEDTMISIKRVKGQPPEVALDLARSSDKGLTIYAFGLRQEKRVGLLRVLVPPGQEGRITFKPDTSELPLTHKTTFLITVAESNLPYELKDNKPEWTWVSTNPQVANYP